MADTPFRLVSSPGARLVRSPDATLSAPFLHLEHAPPHLSGDLGGCVKFLDGTLIEQALDQVRLFVHLILQ